MLYKLKKYDDIKINASNTGYKNTVRHFFVPYGTLYLFDMVELSLT